MPLLENFLGTQHSFLGSFRPIHLSLFIFMTPACRNLGGSGGGNLLEVLALRDCMHLREVRTVRFLLSVLEILVTNLQKKRKFLN